ncbi:MAG: hypothetical protein KDB22_13305 [Planctomycetales bacterium]|nr:hypothetical protein [Planctomycetales bacterium]
MTLDDENEPVDLGLLIADAADQNDIAVALDIIRNGDFVLFQQIDMESGDIEEDEEGNFSVVLAEVDDEIAVVCFSNENAAANFAVENADDLPEGKELPSVLLSGDVLLDGLPVDCGLLLNPGADTECYFPPGCFKEE